MLTQTPDADTIALCDQLHQWCGVHLDASKGYLLANRLRPLMTEYHCKNYADLLLLAQRSDHVIVKNRVIDALTTHETLFFRDQSLFDALASHIIPQAAKPTDGRRPELRVWSAACSSGQEPYSVAMTCLTHIRNFDPWCVSILATDVSLGTLELAKQGVYQAHEVKRGLNDQLRGRFFTQVGDQWQINDAVKRLVKFEWGDLNGSRLPQGPFDLILCRNVLIYFQPDDASRILRSIANRLSPNGRLFVGSIEVPHHVDDVLRTERIGQATCYRRNESTTNR